MPLPHSLPSVPARLLAEPGVSFVGRKAIQDCFERMNGETRAARRQLGAMPIHAGDTLAFTALAMPEHARSGGPTFMVEAQMPVALDVHTLDAASAPEAYSVCVPLSGEFRLQLYGGEFMAQAGEALVIDPAQVELTQVSAGTHFIEFNLPKAGFLSLGAELAPGQLPCAPMFAPLLRGELVERLKFMALQAGDCLLPSRADPARLVMFRRWSELMALTLMDEHLPHARGAAVDPGGPPPGLKRALEFIATHARDDILLADIARVACVSGSGLLRLFRQHLGQAPGTYLRHVRLDMARAELCRGDVASVRALAARWGFQNPGKFSQAYRLRFGESPAETRSARVVIGGVAPARPWPEGRAGA